MSLTFGSLFAGIGGLDLGLERAGMKCEWQVEIDPYALNVLHKHWPDVPKWRDVRTWPPKGLAPGDFYVDLICGGFPCQDISNAGKRAGIDGERSGLWREFARIVRVVRPRYVLVENVSEILVRDLGRVLGDLATCGYDATWQSIQAAHVGAPHRRERVFIVGYSDEFGFPESRDFDCRTQAALQEESSRGFWRRSGVGKLSGAHRHRVRWCPVDSICGVVDGTAKRLDRYRTVGNSVVPQVAEFIGRLIVEHATE